MQTSTVTVVTIMFGDRWKFLSKVIEAVMRDPHVVTMVIVDNGSMNKVEIEEGAKLYGDRIRILRQERNLGSAGGFAKGLEYARTTNSDFVFILDDDSVPEDGAIAQFIEIRKLFDGEKVVLCGNRVNVPRNEEFYFRRTLATDASRGTFFEVFSREKLALFFSMVMSRPGTPFKKGPLVPIAPTEAFVYGGSFIPMEAVREAALPDASLFLYGDDIEYSWNIKKLGYKSYACWRPRLYDIDLTFGTGSHIFGLFEKSHASFKVYYRIRNMVRLSRKHSKQSAPVLFLNIALWICGLYILGLFVSGPSADYFKRIMLLAKAVYAGYFPASKVAANTEGSFFQKGK